MRYTRVPGKSNPSDDTSAGSVRLIDEPAPLSTDVDEIVAYMRHIARRDGGKTV